MKNIFLIFPGPNRISPAGNALNRRNNEHAGGMSSIQKEHARIMHLWVEKLVCDGEQETTAVTFHPIEMKSLASEIDLTKNESGG